MLESLHDHGFEDIDIAHLRVLQYPGPDNMRPSDLASRLRRIVLTPRGNAIVPVIREAVRQTELDWAAALGPDRVEDLRAILLDLAEIGSKP